MDKVSALIVNYGTAPLVLKCVASILEKRVAAAENIIVVDNASPDDSAAVLAKELPQGVQFIPSSTNGGFSAGINIGARLVRTEYLLILNPDTYFIDDSFGQATALLDSKPDIGLVGLNLVYPDGSRQYSARRFYSLVDIVGRRLPIDLFGLVARSVKDHLMTDAWEPGVPFDADWVMGTGFVIRTELFHAIGYMDEAFFLYMEDVDLCARVWKSGRRVVCMPAARLVHDHQRASHGSPFSRSARMHLQSLRLFMQRYRVPLVSKPGVPGIFRQ
ncbi:MAG: glycosyl transferase family 2 [Chloroflexi bacterium]|nr:glycosyl transferase family 2 [Chloroflexota bacterium]|tara:strand:+ start:13913 stop:14734 length:822 start_codon:yes stop_codon:yes gene_type:complete